MVQWLRIHLPMQGTRVRSLVREDSTCCKEALYSQQKQDQELTVAQIMSSLLLNSDHIARDCQMSFGVRGWTHPWMRTIMWIKRGFYLAQTPLWLLLDPLHTSQQPHTVPSGPLAGVMTDMVELAMNCLPLTVKLCMWCLPRGSQAPARSPFL